MTTTIDEWKSWLTGEETPVMGGLRNGSNSKVTRLMALLQQLPPQEDSPQVDLPRPRIVVMGSQSSGKSSLINALVGLPLLPTSNECMCTKVPLSLSISNTTPNDKILLQKDDALDLLNSRNRDNPHITLFSTHSSSSSSSSSASNRVTCDLTEVHAEIDAMGSRIVNDPGGMLHMEVALQECAEMSLVDLPGLTACDRGDLHGIAASADRLRQIAIEAATPADTVILAVMPARADVEVDLVWQVLKQVDPEGDRTAIILTKPDLCLPTSLPLVSKLLATNGSGTVKAKLGYHAVMLAGEGSKEGSTVAAAEKSYFDGTPAFSQVRHKSGIVNVGHKLQQLGHHLIAKHIHKVVQGVERLQSVLESKKRELGPDSSSSGLEISPVAYFSRAMQDFTTTMGKALRGSNARSVAMGGNLLAHALQRLRDDILSNRALTKAWQDTEGEHYCGIHLPETSKVAMLESLLQQGCITASLEPHIEACLASMSEAVTTACKHACASTLKGRKDLAERVESIVDAKKMVCMVTSRQHATIVLTAEEGHAWSTEENFRRALAQDDIVSTVTAYEDCIHSHLAHLLPKILLNGMTTLLFHDLGDTLASLATEVMSNPQLAEESVEIAHERRTLEHQLAVANETLQIARTFYQG